MPILTPLIVACLIAALLGYALGLRRLGASRAARMLSVSRRAAFAGGIATVVVALFSPLDDLVDRSFAAHMVQHLLLMMIAPPLLVWGRPAMAWLCAFPLRARQGIGHAWTGTPGMLRTFRFLTRPLVAYVLASAALWFWHLPRPYDWALRNEGIHVLEHACLFATSLAFWSLVLEPYGSRRMSYGTTLLFVATFGVQTGFLGALLTFARHPLYAAYANTVGLGGITPLEDQQLAGLIMWIPASIVQLWTVCVLIVAWLESAERKAQANARRSRRAERNAQPANVAWRSSALPCLLVAPLVVLVLAGCDAVSRTPAWDVSGGHAAQGVALIRGFGCGACHRIPGIGEAKGNVGPSLAGFGDRVYIAGVLRNNPENLVTWLRDPQQVVPGNAMPDLGLTDQQARDIAAYLYKLR
jgi:cytochrome c oxidase assembly factor CtaG/cytochrome c2